MPSKKAADQTDTDAGDEAPQIEQDATSVVSDGLWMLPTSICRSCAFNGDGRSLESCEKGVRQRHVFLNPSSEAVDYERNRQDCHEYVKVSE